MATGFIAQPTASFDPGFVQAPSKEDEKTQTFQPISPITGKAVDYVPTTYKSGTGSLAPSGVGRSLQSTVPSVSDVGAGGISAGKAAGGAALAALLAKLGKGEGEESQGGLGDVLSGAKKFLKLGDMNNTLETSLNKLRDQGFDGIVDQIDYHLGIDSKFMPDSKAGKAFLDYKPPDAIRGAEGIPEFGGGDMGTYGTGTSPDTSSLGHTGEGLYGTGTPPSQGLPTYDPISGGNIMTQPTTAYGAPIFSAPGVAGMFPGAIAASTPAAIASGAAAAATAAMPGMVGATGVSIPSMGGALAGATAAPTAAAGGAGIGALGAAGMLGIAAAGFMALKGMKKDDPAINRKIAADLGKHAEAAMNGDAGALASIKARLFGDSSAGGEHAGELIKLAISGEPQITSGWQGSIPYGHKHAANYPHHVQQWKPEVQKWYRENILEEHGTIHSTRDKIVGGRSAEDPLQLNPYIDTITPRIVSGSNVGEDGPVDVYMAAKINEQRGGMTPSEANTFYARTGQMPAGFVDWRNNPNSKFYVDPSNQNG